LAAEVKASTSCTGGAWGKMTAIREDEQELLLGCDYEGCEGECKAEKEEDWR